MLVPQRCNIGYDVLVYVGEAFFLNSRDNEHIVKELREKNVSVCRSEVSYLAKKFIVYLSLLHKQGVLPWHQTHHDGLDQYLHVSYTHFHIFLVFRHLNLLPSQLHICILI